MESSNYDLTEYQDSEEVHDAFSKLVSGKAGYKAVIEKRREIPKCSNCGKILKGDEKFCPECGFSLNQNNKQ